MSIDRQAAAYGASVPHPAGERSFLQRSAGDILLRFGLPLLVLAVLIGLWYAAVHAFNVPTYIIPPPEAVGIALANGLGTGFMDTRGFWYHMGVTASEAVIGFVIGSGLGIVAGICVARWKIVEIIVYPYVIALQAMPKVAIAPLIIIWFGFDITGKIVLTSVITFFPLFVNTMAGYLSVDRDRIDFARSCNASELQILHKIILPSALPSIFAGLSVASVLALLGALVAEFVGARAGLGMLLMQYNQSMQLGSVFAILFVLAVLGFLANWSIKSLERRFCGWAMQNNKAPR